MEEKHTYKDQLVTLTVDNDVYTWSVTLYPPFTSSEPASGAGLPSKEAARVASHAFIDAAVPDIPPRADLIFGGYSGG